jgi:hypothetical protein
MSEEQPGVYGRPNISLPEEWSYLLEVFEDRYPNALARLSFSMSGSDGRLEATVSSEPAAAFLRELFLRSPTISTLDASVVVAAPFRSATGTDPMDLAFDSKFGAEPKPTGTDGDEAVVVHRYPSILSKGQLAVGEEISVIVRLEDEPDQWTEGDPTRIADLPASWQTISIDVLLDSAQMAFECASSTITIRRDAKSVPALFYGKILPEAGDQGAVQFNAHFFHKDRRCGFAKRTLSLTAEKIVTKSDEPLAKSNVPTGSATADAEGSVANFASRAEIAIGALSPDLTIMIVRDGSTSSGTYLWTCVASNGSGQSSGRIDLGPSSQTYAQTLLARCAKLEPGKHTRVLRGVAEDIWNVAPPEFRRHYIDLVSKFGSQFSIQIFSDEAYVPWEMMWPKVDGNYDHLFMTHPIARWLNAAPYSAPLEFPRGMIASFVPDYGPSKTLPAAEAEGKWLCERLGATAYPATADSFIDLLESANTPNPINTIHFAGHGFYGDHQRSAAIEFTGNKFVTVEEVSQGGVRLGKRDRSLVVLNACNVGSGTLELGMVSGWGAALTKNGFGGTLAPLWAVQDEDASTLITDALEIFTTKGESLSEAVRNSRAALRDRSSVPYSYMLYGDVTARLAKPTS